MRDLFDLPDDAVKIYFLARDHDDDVAGAVFFLVDRKFDDRRVAVLLATASYSNVSALKLIV